MQKPPMVRIKDGNRSHGGSSVAQDTIANNNAVLKDDVVEVSELIQHFSILDEIGIGSIVASQRSLIPLCN
jgi:hypothetical protein